PGDLAGQLGHVGYPENPVIGIASDGLSAKADLDGPVRQRPEEKIPLRIPLYLYGRFAVESAPLRFGIWQTGFVVAEASLRQCPFESRAADVNRKDASLVFVLLAPARPIHHPQEGWLDPCHS